MESLSFSIRQLTKEFGVTARTLRFYEDEKLIAPGRRGQTRIYSPRDHSRITMIVRGRRLGFSLAELGEMLALYEGEDNCAHKMAHARAKFIERLGALERHKHDIEDALKELRQHISDIDAKMAACETTSEAA